MSKINISFNNTNYSIDESSLSTASAALKSHLSTVMNGSGATINLGGQSYGIDSAKLSAATNAFVSHLGTIAGGNAGGDTLTWDGNTEGKANIIGMHYKVSDAVITRGELTNGCVLVEKFDGDLLTEHVTPDNIYEIATGVLMAGGVFFVSESAIGAALPGTDETFAESGVYFLYTEANHIISVTIPGYNGFGGGSGSKLTVNGVEYYIDPTKVADAVAELETVLGGLNSGGSTGGCDTLTWDGNTEGLVSLAGAFFLVSEQCPTPADMPNGFIERTYSGWEETWSKEHAQQNFAEMGVVFGETVVIVYQDNFALESFGTFPKAGIYFALIEEDGEKEYTTSITIPGYTGFEHSESCGH